MMINMGIQLGLALVLGTLSLDSYRVGTVPEPLVMKMEAGSFTLSSGTAVLAPSRFGRLKRQFEQLVEEEFGLALNKEKHRAAGIIVLSYERRLEAELGSEGYVLVVKKDTIVISSAGDAGIFYGLQRLRQLVKKNGEGGLVIPCMEVRDCPRC